MPALITWWTLDVHELAPDAHSDATQAIGTDLVRRLAEPHRSYHTDRHLVEMFWALEDLEQAHVVTARECTVGRIAAWFHDAVYEPSGGSGQNERDSADLAERALHSLGFQQGDIDTVRDLVLSTEQHEVPVDGLAAAFHDADLWILSADADRYEAYRAQVREEYAAVPDDAFRAGRAAVLRPFLSRDSVYATAYARERWEQQARRNLSAELKELAPA